MKQLNINLQHFVYNGAVVIGLLLLTLTIIMSLTSGRAYAACNPTPICADNLYPTGYGVSPTPISNTDYDASKIDPNYYVSYLLNSCDTVQDMYDTGYGNAFVVNTYPNNGAGSTGTYAAARPLQPDQHPWYAGGGGGNWIGLDDYGWDFSGGGYPISYYLNAANPTSCISPSDQARGGNQGSYSEYGFTAMQQFAVHTASNVDPTTIKLNLTGSVDNVLSAQINGCPLTPGSPLNNVPAPYAATTNGTSIWTAPDFHTNASFSFSLGTCPLNTDGTNDNSLTFMLLSTYDLTGFRISSISLSAGTKDTSGSGGDCPGDSTINSSPQVQVSLPDNTTPSGDSGAGAPSGGTVSYGSSLPGQYQQDVAAGQTKVISVNDISSGGSPLSISHSNDGYQTTTLNYSPYVSTYPYDHNQASVTYQTEYSETIWTAHNSGSPYCSGGGTSVSDSCKYTYTAYQTEYGSCVAGTNADGSANSCASCTPGGSPPSCSYQSPYTVTANGTAEQDYSWSVSSGPYNVWVNNPDASAYKMSPCYSRHFTVTWSSSAPTSASFSPSAEDPTSANSSGTINVHFYGDVDSKSLRQPSVVTLNSGGSFYSNPVRVNGSCSGPNVTVTSSDISPNDETANTTISCSVSAPPLETGDQVCINWNVSPSQGNVDDAGNMSNTSGQIDANPCTGNVTNLPYAQFFGNDVAAGGAFASNSDQCNGGEAQVDGSIQTNMETLTSGSLVRGSGSQLAGLALGSISGFGTASLRANAPVPNGGLMFSNTNPGNLGTTNCIPDYYGSGGSGDPVWAGPPAANSGSHTYVLSGSTLSGFVVPLGTSVTIYAPGSLEITGPILYDGASGAWAVSGNNTNVPSLFVIAKGDITIDPGVSELDGTYVAQGADKQGGTIDTCTGHDFTACSQQLTVYGSFIAKKVNLYRTFASLRDSKPGEYPSPLGNQGNCDLGDNSNPSGSGGPRGTNYDCAAEVFIFSPANYLGQPALAPIGGPNSGKFDAISSLSPVL